MAGTGEGSKPVTLTEAIEDYSAHHPESVAVLCKWPSRRFRRFYELHQKRTIIAGLKDQKDAMVAALWSNPNWDDTKESQGHRRRLVESINDDFTEAVGSVELAFTTREVPEEEKLSKDNPFFAAAEKGLSKVDQRVKQLKGQGHEAGQEEEQIDYMRDIDQT